MAVLGKITGVEQQKRRKNRLNVYLDGAYFQSVSDTVWADAGLKIGQELEEDAWQEICIRQEGRAAMDNALSLLSIRMYSRHEMEQKLREKGFEEDAIHNTIQKLLHYGYINDRELAGMLVREGQGAKGQGPRMLRNRMMKKGIDREIIDEALSQYTVQDEAALVEEQLDAVARRYVREEDPRKRRQKMSAALQRKGFSWDAIRQAMGSREDEEGLE